MSNERQTIFRFNDIFLMKLRKHAKSQGKSMKSIVEECVWPVIKEEYVFQEELLSIKKPECVGKWADVGINIPSEERDRRMKTDKRFADNMAL